MRERLLIALLSLTTQVFRYFPLLPPPLDCKKGISKGGNPLKTLELVMDLLPYPAATNRKHTLY